MNNSYVHFKIPRDISKSIDQLKVKEPGFWEKKGLTSAIRLANYAKWKVPAYEKFLRKNGFKSDYVSGSKAFKDLPYVDKNNYLRKSKYVDLFPKGLVNGATTLSSTSGSTGEPFYFPRGEGEDSQYEYIAEVFLRNQFEIENKRTLGLIGFGLGIWIGGIYTYKNFNKISSKGYPLTLAPVGTNKEIYLKTLSKMADLFEQIILMGYPPFVKDVLDEANEYGVDLSKYEVKIFTATESFSERFRDYLAKKAFIKNKYKDILNVYGSVELGTMSHETPLANLIRSLAVKNKKVYKAIFGDVELLPTLAQFYPHIVYFEEVEGELYGTGFATSFPLVRYRFHDRGGVVGFDEMIRRLSDVGVDIFELAKKEGLSSTIMKLPFVFVHERSDFVVVVRGANIYPQNVKAGLQTVQLEDKVTGRFTMKKEEDKNHDERLLVHVELKGGVKQTESLSDEIREEIVNSLLKQNSEYNYLYGFEGREKLLPIVELHELGDKEYFSRDTIKHKWVIN